LEELFSKKLNGGAVADRIGNGIHTDFGARMKDGWSGLVWTDILNGKKVFHWSSGYFTVKATSGHGPYD
jgi:hypothetical protein